MWVKVKNQEKNMRRNEKKRECVQGYFKRYVLRDRRRSVRHLVNTVQCPYYGFMCTLRIGVPPTYGIV